MRMMMKVVIPTAGGNKAVKDGTIGKIISQFSEEHRPEATYFATDSGERTAYFFVDMKDPSQMVAFAEPFFMGLDARVTFCPAMNAQDLKAGLEKMK